jgi:hypothetical protein
MAQIRIGYLAGVSDPSRGKECGPVCCLWFWEPGTIHWLVYHLPARSIRTYHPGRVDGRYLMNEPAFCDSVRELAEACVRGKGFFVVPVETARRFSGEPQEAFAPVYDEW